VKSRAIRITNELSIREHDLVFKYSRSAGPGGQNVNKVNTRVTILFDVTNCPDLSAYQKRRVLRRLATRTDKNGVLRVISQRHRTQRKNRTAALERLAELLEDALKPKPVRKKTKIPYAAKKRRLEEKKRRSIVKHQRIKNVSVQADLAKSGVGLIGDGAGIQFK